MEAPSAELAWEIIADSDIPVESFPWEDWGANRYLFDLQGIENKPKTAKVNPEFQRYIEVDIEKGKKHAKQSKNRS